MTDQQRCLANAEKPAGLLDQARLELISRDLERAGRRLDTEATKLGRLGAEGRWQLSRRSG
jgi:hypothetical protein